eukprot:1182200-Prorocentrum_minimum.AAC.7
MFTNRAMMGLLCTIVKVGAAKCTTGSVRGSAGGLRLRSDAARGGTAGGGARSQGGRGAVRWITSVQLDLMVYRGTAGGGVRSQGGRGA